MILRVKTNSQIVTWTAFTILARMSFSDGNSDTKLVVFFFFRFYFWLQIVWGLILEDMFGPFEKGAEE